MTAEPIPVAPGHGAAGHLAAGHLAGAGVRGAGRVRRSRGAGPQPYDFRRPTKLSREHVRTLQIAFETFARQWTTLLTSSLRALAQVNLLSIEQTTYDEYVSGLANPTAMHLLTVEPLNGKGVFEMSLSTVMTSIDYLLGGHGTGNQPERPLTDIEITLHRQLVERVLRELRYAFDSLARLEPAIGAVEYNPQFAQVAAATDMVIVASFDVRVGADECVATMCLPFSELTALLEAKLGASATSERERAAREAARASLTASLGSVPVDVAVRFEPVRLTPAALVGLEVGDVLSLSHPVSLPLAVKAADMTFAHAVPGAQGRRLACLVVERDDPTPRETQP